MAGDSWSHKLARECVRPLVGRPVTPNHLTSLRLLTGLTASGLFALGVPAGNLWGGVLWVVSAFLDCADGELARAGGLSSAWGHKFDYFSDFTVTTLFFVGIGIGLRNSVLGWWSVPLGLIAAAGVAAAVMLAERIDQANRDSGKKAWPGFAGFDFDDLLYLFAPVVWLDLHLPFLAGASLGAPAFALISWLKLRRARETCRQ